VNEVSLFFVFAFFVSVISVSHLDVQVALEAFSGSVGGLSLNAVVNR